MICTILCNKKTSKRYWWEISETEKQFQRCRRHTNAAGIWRRQRIRLTGIGTWGETERIEGRGGTVLKSEREVRVILNVWIRENVGVKCKAGIEKIIFVSVYAPANFGREKVHGRILV